MTTFDSQDAVIQWLRSGGVRMEYDSSSDRWSFPSNDLYDLLKSLQRLDLQQKAARTPPPLQITEKPLAALEAAEGVVEWAIDHGAQSESVLAMIRKTIAEVESLAA